MCGRYTRYFTWQELHDLLSLSYPVPDDPLPSSYNIAPTQQAPVCVEDGEGRRIVWKRWGLIPHWAKDDSFGAKAINARSETVASKPAFREAFKKRRCLVPASGFYEWVSIEGQKKKQPLHVHPKDHSPFAFAGLHEHWTDTETGEQIDTYTICTCDANKLMSRFHPRMPCVVEKKHYDAWLDPGNDDRDTLQRIIATREWKGMEIDPVTTRVNNVRQNDEDLIKPIEEPEGSLFG